MDVTIQLQPGSHRSAALGEELAERIAAHLAARESVLVDCSHVESMSPSFANALVMTLLDRIDLDTLRRECRFVNRSELVVQAMNTAAQRFQAGIRLSGQRSATDRSLPSV
jgi:anti-anti-sigma regulatory factor